MLWLVAERDLGWFASALLLILLGTDEVSFRVGLRATRRQPPSEGLKSSVGIVTGGLLALFAFLLAMSFSLASDRYEQRRQSVLDEANALGTAWYRAEMIGGETGAAVRRLLHDYVRVRIGAVRDVDSEADENSVNARTNTLQQQIWTQAMRVSASTPTPITSLFMASLNQVFDLATINRRNLQRGVPEYVVRLLITVAILAVASMGYQFGVNQKRQFATTCLLMLVWTLSIVLILDIDGARNGTVRVSPDPLIWTMESWDGGAS
ncbi:MAG TPA: hypothetical protein VMB73_15965 [Acetobacteraceae bacterium]|jgi:hypothetical protein|nr:hypothetical protein [Acetobacteraceae bacterium]